MAKITSVELSEETTGFISSQVDSGRYRSASEVVRAGLRLLQDQETKMAALRAAIIEGEESGPSQPFDFDEFIASKKARRNG